MVQTESNFRRSRRPFYRLNITQRESLLIEFALARQNALHFLVSMKDYAQRGFGGSAQFSQKCSRSYAAEARKAWSQLKEEAEQ